MRIDKGAEIMYDLRTNRPRLESLYWLARVAIFFGLFTAGVAEERVTHGVLYPHGDLPLVQKYAEYNYRWFDGKLPADSVDIAWGDLTGTYYTDYEGEGFRARISIIQKVEGYDNRVCMEVLHEMVHLKLAMGDKSLFDKDSGPAHDARFQQEMLSLAERGAFTDCW
jgi:hypothetical protein